MNTDSTSENNPYPKLEPSLKKLQALEKSVLPVKNALEQLALCDDVPMAAHCSFMLGGIRSILLHPDFDVCENLLQNSALSRFNPSDRNTVIEAPKWSQRLRGHLFFESHTALFSDYRDSSRGRHRNLEYVQALEELREIASQNRLVVRDGDPIVGPLSQVKHLTFINIQQSWDIFTALLATLSLSITGTQQNVSMLEYDEPWLLEDAINSDIDGIDDEEMREYWERFHAGIEKDIREQVEERRQNTGSFLYHDSYVLEDNIGWDKLDQEMD
jgi:hypothetical protein